MTMYDALVRGRASGCNLALSFLAEATDSNGSLDVNRYRTLVKEKAAALATMPLMRPVTRRLSYSRLSLKPFEGKYRGPFVAMMYVDPREGSYVTIGKSVHHTLMFRNKK